VACGTANEFAGKFWVAGPKTSGAKAQGIFKIPAARIEAVRFPLLLPNDQQCGRRLGPRLKPGLP
jgi:hypothetical protein